MRPTDNEIIELMERARKYTMEQWVQRGDVAAANVETDLSTMIDRMQRANDSETPNSSEREEGSDGKV